MVVEDAITTEEVQVVLVLAEKDVLQAEAVSEATETQRQEAVVLVEEANREVHQRQDVKVDFHQIALQEDRKVQATVSHREHQDVLKVHLIHQEKEDQEEANIHLLIFL